MSVLMVINGKIWLGIILVIASLLASCGLFLFFKNRKLDKQEIESLENDLSLEEKEVDAKVSQNQVDLASMLEQMQKDLEAEPEDIITHFEQDQEEQSIISYQELVKTLKESKTAFVKEKEIMEQTIKEPLNEEVVKIKQGEVTKVEIPVIDLEKPEKSKFQKTDVISPVYGKIGKDKNKIQKKAQEHIEELLQSEDKDYKQVLEATLDLTPLKEEIRRNDEFLASLKEFRRNL